jgi:hypothetical protein
LVSSPDALRIVDARTTLETLARNGEATLRSKSDDTVVVHVLVVGVDGEGADNTAGSGRPVVCDGHPLAEGINETVLVAAHGRLGLTRSPASVFVDERALRDDDGFTGAVLDSPEVIRWSGGVVVPHPLTGSSGESFSADPTLGLDGLESKSIIAVVGSGEDTSGAVHDSAGAGSDGVSMSHVDLSAVEGLDERLGSSREEGARTDHEFELAGNRASRGGAERNRFAELFEGGLGVDASRSSEGGDQGASGGIEVARNKGGASVISIDDEQLVLVGLETFRDTDSDTVSVEGSTRSGSDVSVSEGLDRSDVGVEGNGAGVVGGVVVAVLLVLVASQLIRVLAESRNTVSGDEFASGVAGTTIGIAKSRAGLVVANGLGGVDGVLEPLAKCLGVALVLIIDSGATRLDDAVAGSNVELALSARLARARSETVARVSAADGREDRGVPEAAVRGNAFASS